MFAGHANLPRKGKIVADKDRCTGHETGGKRLVVRVADTQHVGVVLFPQFTATDFDQSEIAQTLVREAVRHAADLQVVQGQAFLHTLDQFDVRDGLPRVRCSRCLRALHFGPSDFVASAVQAELGAAPGWNRRIFD